MASLLWWHWVVLALPILPNLWSIWHIRSRYFISEQEKSLWFILAVFIPVIGGIIYILFGRRKASKTPLQDGACACNKDKN